MKNAINWTRINNDSNGNPRHVCHFLEFIGPKDDGVPLTEKYALAIKRAKTIGGRKYHNKQYGGGIVFQEYASDSLLSDLADRIHKLAGKPAFVGN